MRALVTGASGFIGSALIEELGTLGFDVQALMRKSSSTANLENLRYERVEGDLSDLASLRKAVRNADYVFHLAGITTALNRAAFFEHNAQGTQRLAQAVAEERPGLTRFVYVSSMAAAGPARSIDAPKVETEAPEPVSIYGQSKLKGEEELLRYQGVYPLTIVRPPIVYGPRDKAIFSVVKTIARNNIMPLIGKKYYSAIHVKDLCRGVVQAALAPAGKVASGEIFYLTADGFHSYEEMLGMIADRLNRDPIRIQVPHLAVHAIAAGLTAVSLVTRRTFPLSLDKVNELKPDFWICSSQKAKRQLGFSPEFDLARGMANAIEWYKRQRWL